MGNLAFDIDLQDNISAYKAINQDNNDEKQRPVKICVMGYASSMPYSFPKDGQIIEYKEITITTTPDFIHFLSRKKSSS